MRRLIALLVLILSLLATWYFLSPWLAMKQLRDAAQNQDRAALSRQVDFPALRTSLKAQLRDRFHQNSSVDGSLLGQLGNAFASGAVDQSVDFAINPEGVAALLTGGALASAILPDRATLEELDWDVQHDGFNQFRGTGSLPDGEILLVLVFQRQGVGWRLFDVRLPDAD